MQDVRFLASCAGSLADNGANVQTRQEDDPMLSYSDVFCGTVAPGADWRRTLSPR